MLIIGKIPDIFDHMPYAYGVDNKVIFDKRVYNTLPEKTINTLDAKSYCADLAFSVEHGFDRNYYIENKLYDSWKYYHRRNNPNPAYKYSFSNFFYCGRIYLLAAKLALYENGQCLGYYKPTGEIYTVYDKQDGEPYYIEAPKAIIDYAKDYNIPFFEYVGNTKQSSYVTIQPQINYLPIHKILHPMFGDANVIYNEIYNYLLSFMNDDDIIQVSNEDKIKQAGFDLKTSFRKM